MLQEFTALDGAILIDKPSGPTSHDVVDAIRRQFGIKKVGHCGTLDPNATGLLVIVLGRGTKLSEKLMSDDELDIGALLLRLWRGRYWLLGALVLAASLAALHAYLTQPVYRSEILLSVRSPDLEGPLGA